MRSERKEPLDFEQRPYLRAILRDDRPRQVWVACAQSGKTVTGLSKLFHFLCHPPDGRPRTVIYTFPTQTEVHKFSKMRAKPMILASPFLRSQIGDVDSAEVKLFANGSAMYFQGTFTDRQATSIPADLLVHDELDKSVPGTIQMYEDRTSNSPDPRKYLYSTPTIPNYGITAEWELTDQREWVWKCGCCGRDQIFAPMDRSVPWQEMLDFSEYPAAFRCGACRAEVQRQWILAGRWVAQAPENRGRAGYHLTAIMPPQSTAARLAEAWKDAKYPELFVQGKIGLPEVAGDKSVTEDMIAFGEWPNTLQHAGPLFAGLDQGKKLDFIAGDGAGQLVCVWRFDDWSEVASAMRTLNIRMLVCDQRPDERAVQKLMGDFPGRVLGADYSLNTVKDEEWFTKDPNHPHVAIARTPGLDATREPLIMGGQGGDVFPAMAPELRRVLLAQLCASVRTRTEDAKGRPVANWVETGPDHLRHAHLYYRVACVAEPLSWWQSELHESEQQLSEAEPPSADPSADNFDYSGYPDRD
jgi:hypothetical protein